MLYYLYPFIDDEIVPLSFIRLWLVLSDNLRPGRGGSMFYLEVSLWDATIATKSKLLYSEGQPPFSMSGSPQPSPQKRVKSTLEVTIMIKIKMCGFTVAECQSALMESTKGNGYGQSGLRLSRCKYNNSGLISHTWRMRQIQYYPRNTWLEHWECSRSVVAI